MSTLSEHTGNGNLTVTSRQPEGTKAELDALLQHFDVLPARFDRVMFKSIYVSLLGLFFAGELLVFLSFLSWSPSPQFQIAQVGWFLLTSGLNALPIIFIVVIWRFTVWRAHTAKTLLDLSEKKRISLPDGDVYTSYLGFLESYRDALASPKKYVLCGVPMLLAAIIQAYSIVQSIPDVLIVVWNVLLLVELVVGVYCIGIVIWVMYISGWYIRKLVRVFELKIQPSHPDKCGGLKSLGNFCFGLGSPILIGSGLTIGYLVLFFSDRFLEPVFLALVVGFALLLLLAYALPAAIFAFILPLRDIHTKMVSEGEREESLYIARIEALREEIYSLLATKQVEAAKVLQEEKALLETLYISYPTWPFRFRAKISSTLLEISGSLLIGVMAGEIQQYFLPTILTLLFHRP